LVTGRPHGANQQSPRQPIAKHPDWKNLKGRGSLFYAKLQRPEKLIFKEIKKIRVGGVVSKCR